MKGSTPTFFPVIRGGGWLGDFGFARVFNRGNDGDSRRSRNLGLRLARRAP